MIGCIDTVELANKSLVLRWADISLSPLRIALNGKSYSEAGCQTEKKVYSLVLRIFAAIAALVLSPVLLMALAVKWCTKHEWQIPLRNQVADPLEIDRLLQDPHPACPLSRSEFKESLKKELDKVRHLDVKLGPPAEGSWRKFGKRYGEYNQRFSNYHSNHQKVWPDKEPLAVQRLGDFDECDLKIIAITADFLRVFHQKPVSLREEILTMDELKARDSLHWQNPRKKELAERFPRKNGQYDAEQAVDLIQRNLQGKRGGDIIAFTSEDLFTPMLSNFVFGVASLTQGAGIWSKARFGDPKKSLQAFEKCLIRMMKIAAHEFGHMRGIPHCTDYECNIGGYMSLSELDERPLLYCLQDSAKICSLARITLLEYHQRLLTFFEKFNHRYGLNCDLTKEIDTLNGRIQALKAA